MLSVSVIRPGCRDPEAARTRPRAGLRRPAEPGIAYVAGEARTVQAVRAHLVRNRGRPRRSVLVKPFWTPGG
ncbi:SIP domain-containing protein [Actinomadura meyerae]|uniref:SIP domain-containing protein n=1 Tax=Actinomadura meyerae TaxID=240840 RepID=UPI002482B5E8|nr:SIP domain-containing protein [Actinomadura meyerae]